MEEISVPASMTRRISDLPLSSSPETRNCLEGAAKVPSPVPTILSIASSETKDWIITETLLLPQSLQSSLKAFLRAPRPLSNRSQHPKKYFYQLLLQRAHNRLTLDSYLLSYALFPLSSLYLHVF